MMRHPLLFAIQGSTPVNEAPILACVIAQRMCIIKSLLASLKTNLCNTKICQISVNEDLIHYRLHHALECVTCGNLDIIGFFFFFILNIYCIYSFLVCCQLTW